MNAERMELIRAAAAAVDAVEAPGPAMMIVKAHEVVELCHGYVPRRKLPPLEGDPPDMEKLAELEHASWARWLKYMLEEIAKDLDASYLTPAAKSAVAVALCPAGLACVQRWRRQMDASYHQLSEKERESDRSVVRGKLALYRPSAFGPQPVSEVSK
jgi:hypothetical protein